MDSAIRAKYEEAKALFDKLPGTSRNKTELLGAISALMWSIGKMPGFLDSLLGNCRDEIAREGK